jgi:hypothetical protein
MLIICGKDTHIFIEMQANLGKNEIISVTGVIFLLNKFSFVVPLR